MIRPTWSAAAVCLGVSALVLAGVPAASTEQASSSTAPVSEAGGLQVVGAATEEAPETTLVELDVVVPPVEGDQVQQTPELVEARADDQALAAEQVVADRVTTESIPADTFQTIGVTWPEGATAATLDAQVRVLDGGEWSAWTPMEVGDEAPDAGTADAANGQRGGTDPLWVGEAEAVQLSFAATSEGGPEDLALVMVGSEAVPLPPDDRIVGEIEVDAAPAAFVTGELAAASPAVQVISREAWGARAQVCTPDVAAQLVGAVVHHTAGSNDYRTVDEAMQQIRNDQRYHIDGRGWCDLGYNFVVDKWGNIYEGRAKSLTQPVIGVHAGGFNTGTVGVSMLGTYAAVPSAATQQSVAQIIGWRLGAYGVSPTGSMSYATGSGENSKYTNTTVTLPRVFGHRDVAYTNCPGDGGYAALGNIRVIADSFSYAERFRQAKSVVRALYEDILGRGVDPSGLQTWSGMLAAGSGGPALVQALTSSDEYIRLRITQAYREVLGREPEPAGMTNWHRAIRGGGATVDDVQRQFLSSAEFMARAGGTNAGYVRRMYTSVLGRAAGDAEVQHWLQAIAAVGRERVTDAIWFSTEAANRRAGVYYQTFLKRAPDPAGQAGWASILLRYGEGAVRVGIAGSEEYRLRALARYP
jgi:hypothetical protein